MSSVLNTPLPGDLVIRPQRDAGGVRRAIVFTVAVWPSLEVVGGPYQSYGYARRQAKAAAAKRQVQLWRDHSTDPERPQLENVSDTDE